MKKEIDSFVERAARASGPAGIGAAWSCLLDQYEQLAGASPSAWREAFHIHGGELLIRAWPAAMAGIGRPRPARGGDLERVAAELGDVLARLDRSQPLIQCYDDDFFQERWIELGVRDALQGVLPGNMDDIVDTWLRSINLGTERLFGEASLFLLLCVMRDHLERRSGAQDRLRSAAIAAGLGAAGSEYARAWWDEAAIELFADSAGDEYDDEGAGLRVVEWAAIVELQPRAMKRPDGVASLWPIFVGLASRSGVAGVQTLRNLLRLVAPPHDAAPAQLLLWFGIALVARRHGRDEVWQPRLEDILARLAGHLPESWHQHLGGLVTDDEELTTAVRLAERVAPTLLIEAAPPFASSLGGAVAREHEQAARNLARIGRPGGRSGRVNGWNLWELAAAEHARVEPLLARADAATLDRIDELEKEIARQCDLPPRKGRPDEIQRRLRITLDGYSRALQSLARIRALSRSRFAASAIELACFRRQREAGEGLTGIERQLAEMLLEIQRVEARVPDVDLSVPRAGEVVLDVLEASLLRDASKAYLVAYFAARPAAEIDAREILKTIARGRATGWDPAGTVAHRWERGESRSRIFDLMLQLGDAVRGRCGDKACTFFDEQIRAWRSRADDLAWRREVLEALGRWLAPSDRELQQALERAGDASSSMPAQFSDVTEITELVNQLDGAIEAAWRRAGAALTEAGARIHQLKLTDADLSGRQLELDAERVALETPVYHSANRHVLVGLTGRIASHVDYVTAFVERARSPILTLVREFLPEVGSDFPEGESTELTRDQFLALGAGKIDGSSRPWIEAGLRHAALDALSKGADRPRKERMVGALCLAWVDVRLLSETDPEQRVRLLADALLAQTALGLRLMTRPSRSSVLGRYHPLAEAERSRDRVPVISAGARLCALIAERLPPARRDELHELDPDRRIRSALLWLEDTDQPFEEYRRVADALYACSAMVARYETQVAGAALDAVIQTLPSIEVCQTVRPDLRGKSELPTIEYARSIWRLVLTYAAAYGRVQTVAPTGFGALLGNRSWTDLLKRTGALGAVDNLLKYLRRIQSTEVGVDARQYARHRLDEAHTELARHELTDRMRKESDSAADVLLRQLARVANEYLHAASPVREHVPLEVTTPWTTCFYDAQARRAWFYLNVRNLAREGAAEYIELEADWKPLDRTRTLDEEDDSVLRFTERLYAGEQCARRIFVSPEWIETATNRALHVDLVFRYDRGTGRKTYSALLTIQHYRPAELKDEAIFYGSKGRAVTGRDFYGRDKELTRMERALERGYNVELRGIRGIGKSSLLNELIRRVEARENSRWIFVQLQTYGMDSVPNVGDWYANIAVKLRQSSLGDGLDVATLLATDPSPLVAEALQELRKPDTSPGLKASYLAELMHRIASQGWKILLVFDQLEQLEDLWNHQQTGRPNVVHFIATLREWANDDKIRTAVHWILSGPPSFFDTIDQPDTRTRTQPHAGRGSELIEVLPLDDASEVRAWIAAEVRKWLGDITPDQFYDSAFTDQLMQLSGGHPWIMAIYGHAVAELASREEAVHRALTCADIHEAEQRVFQGMTMDELRNRFVGDSLQKGPHTRLSYLLLIQCALKTDKTPSVTRGELEETLRDEDILEHVRDEIGPTMAGLVRRGLLRQIGDGYACASHFLRRFFVDHPTLGNAFVERKVREIRAGEADARVAPIRHAPSVRLPVVAADWSQQFQDVANEVTGRRDAAGRVARLLSLALNCGPVHAVSHAEAQWWRFFESVDPAGEVARLPDRSEEALRVLRETQQLLDEEMDAEQWEPLCPHRYGRPTTWTSISMMAEEIAKGIGNSAGQRAACNQILDELRGNDTKRWIHSGLVAHVRQHVDRHRGQVLLDEPDFNDGWSAPFFDVVAVVRKSDLVECVVRSIARHSVLDGRPPVRIALSFFNAYRKQPVEIGALKLKLKLMYLVMNLQWTGRTFGETAPHAGRDRVEELIRSGEREWITGAPLERIKPFAHVLFRTQEVDREPFDRELTALDGASGPFPTPWRDGDGWSWTSVGHTPQTFPNGLALAFPILRS